MAWLSSNSFTSGSLLSHVHLNNLANDIRAWGGDVNAGGYALSNLSKISTGSAVAAQKVAVFESGANFYGLGMETASYGAAMKHVAGTTGGHTFYVDSSHLAMFLHPNGTIGWNTTDTSAAFFTAAIPGVSSGFYIGFGANKDNYFTSGSSGAQVWRADATERMRLSSGGLLGVGTPSASAQVHVYGAGQATAAMTDSGSRLGAIYLQDSAGAGGNGGAILFGALQGHFAAIKSKLFDGGGATTGDLSISLRATSGSSALTERFWFTKEGRLGIGVAPFGPLAIAGLGVHADQAAATGAGLTAGNIYRTSTGELRIVV